MPEIVAPVLRNRAKIGVRARSNRAKIGVRAKIEGDGVQSVINAIVAGNLDDHRGLHGPVTYLDARADIVAKLSPSGEVKIELIDQASATLYQELLWKNMPSAGVDPIQIQEGDHT